MVIEAWILGLCVCVCVGMGVVVWGVDGCISALDMCVRKRGSVNVQVCVYTCIAFKPLLTASLKISAKALNLQIVM